MRRRTSALPSDSAARKGIPIASGFFDYFTAAIAECARLSQIANEKHNPRAPLHWARGKSDDHADCLQRHFAERGAFDTDGVLHSVKVMWRACAIAQLELEALGAPMARGARGSPRRTPPRPEVASGREQHQGEKKRRARDSARGF